MPEDDQQQNDITLEQLQADLDETTNNWKRALADFENFKKQKERENKELLEFAKEVTVVKLLPTLDALGQALKHIPVFSDVAQAPGLPSQQQGTALHYGEEIQQFGKAYQNWQIGINGILSQLDKTLEELGVKKIEAVGKKFDPHLHEAVREAESDADDGIIIDELQTGFELNGKVIRPSQVVISKQK